MIEATTTEEKLNHLRTLGKVTLTSTACGCLAALMITGENKSVMRIVRKHTYLLDDAIQHLYKAVTDTQSSTVKIFK